MNNFFKILSLFVISSPLLGSEQVDIKKGHDQKNQQEQADAVYQKYLARCKGIHSELSKHLLPELAKITHPPCVNYEQWIKNNMELLDATKKLDVNKVRGLINSEAVDVNLKHEKESLLHNLITLEPAGKNEYTIPIIAALLGYAGAKITQDDINMAKEVGRRELVGFLNYFVFAEHKKN